MIGLRERVDPDRDENFTVLMGNYGAVLIEWLFMDNKEDLEKLQDDNINQLFVSSIIKSLLYIDKHLDLIF